MTPPQRGWLTLLALPLGLALLVVAVVRADLRALEAVAGQLGAALPLVLLPGAAWHFVRTVAWHQCFASDHRPPFWRLFRIRLAAEAFSFVTVRGVGGEPLKVTLLGPAVAADVATAAVALERILYLVVTTVIVSAASAAALIALPLTRTWTVVFVSVGLITAAIAAGLVALLLRPLGSELDFSTERSHPNSLMPNEYAAKQERKNRDLTPLFRFLRFLRSADAQLRVLAHTDGKRLVGVGVLEVIAYVAMVLEVLATLRAAGVPASLTGSLAIETFTRVASMVSAFIPANLGALEAANVAAAGIIAAAAAAAPLAVVRRLRGLFWCAAGFACYPASGFAVRAGTPRAAAAGTLTIRDDPAAVPPGELLGGMPIGERIIRAAARAGFQRVLVLPSPQRDAWQSIAPRTRGLISTVVVDDETDSRAQSSKPRVVMSSSLVPSPARLAASRAAALASEQPVELAPVEADLRVRSRGDLQAAERQLRASLFKPTDGRVARFNRRLSIPMSVALVRWTRCSANAMTVVLIALGLYAGWLFSIGSYSMGVLAAVVSLAASILDGCDGELARLQYQESAFGVWLDTLGDYSYYLAIFTGLIIGTAKQTGWQGMWWIGAALLAGSLATFALLILLRQRITQGRPERLRAATQTHFEQRGRRWTSLAASLSTVATRATMPYGILAFAIADALPAIVVLAAIGANAYWISLALELGRLLGRRSGNLPSADPARS
jgi:phosphatidylglycerophosphate synthase